MSRDFHCFSDVSELALFILNKTFSHFAEAWRWQMSLPHFSFWRNEEQTRAVAILSMILVQHANIPELDYDMESYSPISYHKLKQVFHWTYAVRWNFDLFLPISHNKTKKGQKLFLIRKIVPLSLAQPCSDSSKGKKLCRSKILYYISLILLLSIYTSHMQAEKKGKGEKKKWFKWKKNSLT